MNIYDKAKAKIHKKYMTQYDYSLELTREQENAKINKIDSIKHWALCSKENFAKTYVKVFWTTFTHSEQAFLVCCGMFFGFITLFVLLRYDISPLNFLILDVSNFFFLSFLILCIYCFYRLLKKSYIKSKLYYICWCVFFLLSVPYIPKALGYKTTQIGDFYEALEYKEKYYVTMSRNSEDNPERKIYTLPAEIERRYDYEGTTHSDNLDDTEHDIYSLNYHINYLYFPNGGYLRFSSDEIDSIVSPEKECQVEDCEGSSYYITLSAEKVK